MVPLAIFWSSWRLTGLHVAARSSFESVTSSAISLCKNSKVFAVMSFLTLAISHRIFFRLFWVSSLEVSSLRQLLLFLFNLLFSRLGGGFESLLPSLALLFQRLDSGLDRVLIERELLRPGGDLDRGALYQFFERGAARLAEPAEGSPRRRAVQPSGLNACGLNDSDWSEPSTTK